MDQTSRPTLFPFDIDIKCIQSIFFPTDFSGFFLVGPSLRDILGKERSKSYLLDNSSMM